MNEGFGSLRHLSLRLAGSLWPAGPPPGAERWARSWLLASELPLWARMSGPDRRHALGVARQVAAELAGPEGSDAPRAVMAAALLHDVGKIDAALGTWGRVAVTALAIKIGRERIASWSAPGSRWRSRAGRYVTHDRVGGELLAAAGSDSLTVAWASQHHVPAGRRSFDPRLGAVLEAADGD